MIDSDDHHNEKDSLLAGTSFSSSPPTTTTTFASTNITNQFWRFHSDLQNDDNNNGMPRGLVGLYNQGNSCYMNAATQALSNCPPLREYFRSYLPAISKDQSQSISDIFTSRRPITDAFQDLIIRMWSGKKNMTALRPVMFLYKIKERCPQFKGYTQQDSQEFIQCFLDLLHQELRHSSTFKLDIKKDLESRNSVSSSCSSSEDGMHGTGADRFETADSGLSSDAGESTKNVKVPVGIPSKLPVVREKQQQPERTHHKSESERSSRPQIRSIITDVFDGELISTVKCMTCHHLSNTREAFQDISLSIPTLEQIAILRDSQPLNFEASEIEEEKSSSTHIKEEEMEENEGGGEIAEQSSSEASTKSSKTVHETSLLKYSSYNTYAYWAYAIAKSWLIDPWLSYIIYVYRFMFAENISLEDCLYAFFSADHLHGDDMYSCEKCKKLRNGLKQCRLTSLPEILCIHLKRFRHDNLYNSKINTRVTFPLCDLDMKPYMLKSAVEQYEQEGKSTEYDLVGFVSHRGSGAEYGHYVAYCYNSVDGFWYEYDDQYVTRVEDSDVLLREAYVLFYQKKSTEASEAFKQKVTETLATLNESDSEAYYISTEWLYRFRTFSDPGPITNTDFLCEHLGQAPLIQPNQVLPIPSKIWKLLHERYGGGPPCVNMVKCSLCEQMPFSK